MHSLLSLDHAVAEAELRASLVGESPYPMYVISVKDFIERYSGTGRQLERQQVLREAGIAKKWNGSGEVLFVSHEWTDFAHPDHSGIQLKELVIFLERLSSGKIAKVESSWEEQINFRRKTIVEAAEWKERMATAWIWLDFVSVPQLSVETFAEQPAEGRRVHVPESVDVDGSADNPAGKQRRKSADARFAASGEAEGMKELEVPSPTLHLPHYCYGHSPCVRPSCVAHSWQSPPSPPMWRAARSLSYSRPRPSTRSAQRRWASTRRALRQSHTGRGVGEGGVGSSFFAPGSPQCARCSACW